MGLVQQVFPLWRLLISFHKIILRLHVSKNNLNQAANGTTLGKRLQINTVSMYILACTVSYGPIYLRKHFNFQIIPLRNILESLSHRIFHERFIKDTLWKDSKGKIYKDMSSLIALFVMYISFKHNQNFRWDIPSLTLKKTLYNYLTML